MLMVRNSVERIKWALREVLPGDLPTEQERTKSMQPRMAQPEMVIGSC
jgi:hypothetical protein